MSPSLLSLYISVSFVVSASPGPLMLACMSYGARVGVRATVATMLGASLGNILLMLLSALGLGLLITQTPWLLSAIKWIGALYLIYLGLQQWRAKPQTTGDITSAQQAKSLFFSGMMISLSNPKGLIYFGAIFPQFIDYNQPLVWQFSILTLIFLALDMLWMLIYAAAGYRLMRWLTTPRHQSLFNMVTGLVLIGAGFIMIFTGTLIHE